MPDSTAIVAMLAAVSMKVLLLAALGALAALALRRSSAACRHLLWTTVLAGVLLISLSAPLPASWSLPFASIPLPRSIRPDDATPILGTPEQPAQVTPYAARARPDDAAAQGRRRALVADLLVLLWIGGVGIFALRRVAGQVALWRLAADARTIEAGPAGVLLRRMAGPTGIGRRVRLIETGALPMPATWGVFRPVVAMPAEATTWPECRLEAAISHELAHVRRRDAMTQLGADLCCALLWFHPAVWLAARAMRAESERACDDAVLSAGAADVGYAELLLALAAGMSRQTSGVARTAMRMADGRELEGRLRAILDPALPRSSPGPLLAAVQAVALVAAVTIAGLDVWRPAPVHALVSPRVQEQALATPDSLEILFGERLPFTAEQERQALSRRFRPRDERERQAFASIRYAARHIKQDPVDLIRERAIWALWIAEDDQVVDPLVAQLTNADWRARSYAAWNLSLVGASEAREAVTSQLRDPVWRVRAMAAVAIAEFADPRSIDDMLPLLADPAWQVRVPAVEYLSRIRTPAALAAVRTRLNDPHVAVRYAAEAALGEPPTR
jgi:beta-lactamase regulating signal transducer with metallopeptidase domain